MPYRFLRFIRFRRQRTSRLDALILFLCLVLISTIFGGAYLHRAGYFGRYVAPVRVGKISTRPVNEALLTAIRNDDEATVRSLLASGANPDSTGRLSTHSHVSAIQSAATHGNLEIVQMLLDHGADINAPGEFSENAVRGAALFGHAKVVRLLIEHGADLDSHNGHYSFALANARYGLKQHQSGRDDIYWQNEKEYRDTIDALIQAGAHEGSWWPPARPTWWHLSWWPF